MQFIELLIAGGFIVAIALEVLFGVFDVLEADAHRGFSWSCALLSGLFAGSLLVGSPPGEAWVRQVATFAVGLSAIGLVSAYVSSLLESQASPWRAPALANAAALLAATIARIILALRSAA